MRTRLVVLAMAVAVGPLLPVAGNATPQSIGFDRPMKVNADGFGYEPSIDVDSHGTLYVTAHKGSATNEGTRLSSFLWSSSDRGATWRELPSPANVRNAEFSFEGDIAVDGHDRLYFVDTYGGDTWLSRWSSDRTFDRSAPAITASVFDDRPWITTQGDDVWLLTTDVASHAADNGPPEAADGSGWASSAVLYRSTDGGLTWSAGHAFADAQFCGIAASPRDDHSLAVACVTRVAGRQHLVVHRTADNGTTWTARDVLTYRGRADSFVSIAYDRGGTLTSAVADVVSGGNRLYVATGTTRGWSVRDVTPFRGSFQHVWTTAGAAGHAGLAFYGTGDVTPSSTSRWHVYAGSASGGRWSIVRADPVQVMQAAFAPADFLQCVIAPDGRLYVAYSRAATTDVLHAPPPDFDHDIYVVRSKPIS
jgi:hypothetical protein